MRNVVASALITLAVIAPGCAGFGPKPKVTAVEAEIKATPEVDKILVVPTLNTNTNKPKAPLNRAVPSLAHKRYGERLLLATGLANTGKTLGIGAEAHLPDNLPISWQVAFHHWLKTKTPKSVLKLPLPPAAEPVKDDTELKALNAKLKARSAELTALSKASQSANAAALDKAAAAAPESLKLLESAHRYLCERLGVTYLLLSSLEGDLKSFKSNKPITLHIALINPTTGRFRYYAQVATKQTDVRAATYDSVVATMAQNALDAAKDFDAIE